MEITALALIGVLAIRGKILYVLVKKWRAQSQPSFFSEIKKSIGEMDDLAYLQAFYVLLQCLLFICWTFENATFWAAEFSSVVWFILIYPQVTFLVLDLCSLAAYSFGTKGMKTNLILLLAFDVAMFMAQYFMFLNG